jgi:hypothetical protein
LDTIQQVIGFTSLGNDFQIFNTLPYRYLELMGVDDSTKGDARSLPSGRLGQQIIITREQYPSKGSGSIQEGSVFQCARSIRIRGDHLNLAPP